MQDVSVQVEAAPTRFDNVRNWAWLRFWYPVRYEWPERVQRGIANRAPRWLVYFVTIRACSEAWARAGDKHPDELTFDEIMKPWEKRRQWPSGPDAGR